MEAKTAKQISSLPWYNRVDGALALSLLSFGAAYLLSSRAIDTGSLQQYFLAFAALVFAAYRFIWAIKQTRRTS